MPLDFNAGMRVSICVCFVAAVSSAQSDLFSASEHRHIVASARPDAVVFSSDGKHLVVGTARDVAVVRTEDGSVARQVAADSATAVDVSRDGAVIAVGQSDGTIRLFDANGSTRGELRGTRGRVRSLAFAPAAPLLASCGEDRNVILWDTNTGRQQQQLASPAKPKMIFVGFGSGGATVVGVNEAGSVIQWDANNGRVLRNLQDQDGNAFSAALNYAGTLLAVGTEFATMSKGNPMREAHPSDFHREERLKIYDLSKGAIVKQIDGVDGQLRGLSFSSDSRFLAAARQRVKGTFLSVYDAQRGVEITARPMLDRSSLASFSPDGRWLGMATPEGGVALLAVSGVGMGGEAGDLAGQKVRVTSADRTPMISARTKTVIAVMDLEGLRLDADTGRAVAEMLRNRISGTPNIEMVARDRMQQVIKEQNFQYSARADSSTAVALGKILNASKIIFGSVSALGTSYTISVQMVDVETAVVNGIREVLCQRCAIEDMPLMVAELKATLVGGR